jgi:spore maturation protein A
MLNIIWLALVVFSVIIGCITGKIDAVVSSVTDSAKFAFDIALGLTGILTFWLGLMRIAKEAGLVQKIGHLLKPIFIRLFPEIPANHPAMGSITLNIVANMLGLNNAATPFGLRAMEDLQQLNKNPDTATNAMCMLLAINTSSIQLIPATAIAYLAAAGATHPTDIVTSTLLATTCSTIAGIIAAKCLEKIC